MLTNTGASTWREDVRRCLEGFDDVSALGRSPLAAWHATIQRLDPLVARPTHLSVGRAVRQLLGDAIELLQPPPPIDVTMSAWRRHLILDRAYRRRQSSAFIYSAVLAISKSEYYRERQESIEAVTDLLGEIEFAAAGDTLARAGTRTSIPSARHLVGRERELAVGAGWLGAGRAVAITGMAGCGKTALAAELALRAAGRRVLWARFVRGQLESIEDVMNALAPRLARDGHEALIRLLARRTVTGQTAPAGHLWSALASDLSEGRYLLCVDDVHLVAADSVLERFISRLADEASGTPTLFAGRSPCHLEGRVPSVVLRGISRSELALWLGRAGIPTGRSVSVAHLHHRTAGHPGYLQLLLTWVQQRRGVVHPAAEDLLASLETVESRLWIGGVLFDDFLADLNTDARELVTVMAVLDAELNANAEGMLHGLARVLDIDSLEGLRRLREAAVLRVESGGLRLELHPLLRDYALLRLRTGEQARIAEEFARRLEQGRDTSRPLVPALH